jgi:UDP-glucose:(heptosyl)LPS alpha-1,3-glucosyltransferase
MSRAVERWCYTRRTTSALVAVSKGVAGEVAQAYPRRRARIDVISNGVDLDRFRPNGPQRESTRRRYSIADDSLLALFVGSDWGRKGLDHAIKSVSRTEGVELLIVGAGDRARAEASVESAGASGRVHFAGAQRDVRKFYAAADVFVLPTAYEAFPLVVLEAAACGLPLLVTAVNGAVELVRDGETGYVIRADADDIGRRLRDLRDDPEARIRMAEAARTAVLDRTWDRAVDDYDVLIRELAGPTVAAATHASTGSTSA